jgi:exopolysaccharide production protein ExoZ
MRHTKIEIIQIIRGLSALGVVFFHCKSTLTEQDSLKGTIDWLFNSGAAGVDIFFIISGFIMVYSTRSTTTPPQEPPPVLFFFKRMVRVWPPYAVVTVLYLFILSKLTVFRDPLLLKHTLKSLFFLPVTPGDAPFYGYPLLRVGWSLNYEVYFYTVFAVSLFFRSRRYVFLFGYFMLSLLVAPLVFTGFVTLNPHLDGQFRSLYLSFLTNPIMWEFVVGMVLGLLYTNEGVYRLVRKHTPVFVPYTLLLLASWQYLSGFWGGHGLANWGLAATLLVFVCVFYLDTITCPRALVRLGEYSFSLYLIHVPVQVLIIRLFEGNNMPVFARSQSALVLIVGTALLFSYFSYHLLERKLSGAFLKLMPGKRSFSLSAYLRRW